MNTLTNLSSNNATIQQMLWDNPSVFDAKVKFFNFSFDEFETVYHFSFN